MESLSLPTTAHQANLFMAPESLSFPIPQQNQIIDISSTNKTNSASTLHADEDDEKTDQATAGGVSGIVPTLQ